MSSWWTTACSTGGWRGTTTSRGWSAATGPATSTRAAPPVPGGGRKRVVAFCGVARPAVFFDDLRALGADSVETRAYPDHARYDARRLDELRRLGDAPPGDITL